MGGGAWGALSPFYDFFLKPPIKSDAPPNGAHPPLKNEIPHLKPLTPMFIYIKGILMRIMMLTIMAIMKTMITTVIILKSMMIKMIMVMIIVITMIIRQ